MYGVPDPDELCHPASKSFPVASTTPGSHATEGNVHPAADLRTRPATSSWPPKSRGSTATREVNVSQIVTLDRSVLSDWTGTVDSATLRQIEAGMALALDLSFRH